MPLKQLRIVEKIKFLISNNITGKRQIADDVGRDAKEHRIINQVQEREDDDRVKHAQKELNDEENKIANRAYSRMFRALVISIFINVILFVLIWYFIFYR